METMTLKAELRDKKGSKHCRRMRKQGAIPAVLYGHKENPVMLSVGLKEATKLISQRHRLVKLALADKTEQVFVKDVKYDSLTESLVHIDFTRVAMDEMMTLSVEIVLKGHPKGIIEGGVLEQNLRNLNIKCLPTEIPAKIEVDVAPLGIGDLVRVKDVKLPKGVTATVDGEVVVAGVHLPKEEVVAPTPAEGAALAEPEVLTAKKETAEGEEKEKGKGAEKTAAKPEADKKAAAVPPPKAGGKEEKK